jgi:hypothetical protein
VIKVAITAADKAIRKKRPARAIAGIGRTFIVAFLLGVAARIRAQTGGG